MGLATSCSNDKIEVEKWEIKDVRITSVKITSKPYQKETENTFYSIDQAQGIIFNAIPISFGTKLDKIKLDINTFQFNEVKYALGDSQDYISWNKIDSIDIKGNDIIRLQVEDREHTMKKDYAIHINIYKFDPLTIVWDNVEASGITVDSKDEFFTFQKDGKVMVYASNREGNRSELYTMDLNNPGVFSKQSMKGLDGVIYSIQKTEDKFYACVQKENRQILESNDGISWQAVNANIEGNFSFLGAIKSPSGGKEILTLAVYNEGQSGRYAILSNGKVEQYEEIQNSFPVEHFAIFGGEDHYRPMIRLYGGSNSSKLSHGYWETTNGKDWLTPTLSFTGQYPFSTSAAPHIAQIKNLDLMFAKGKLKADDESDKDLIFYSVDKCKTWQLGQADILLPKGMIENSFLFAFNGKDNNIYLATSVHNENGAVKLYKGTRKLKD